jgi:hypothetical protein
MPLFQFLFFQLCTYCTVSGLHYLHGDAADLKLGRRLKCRGLILKKVEIEIHNSPTAGLEPMPHTSVALSAQYPNVRQRKLLVRHYYHSDCSYPTAL